MAIIESIEDFRQFGPKVYAKAKALDDGIQALAEQNDRQIQTTVSEIIRSVKCERWVAESAVETVNTVVLTFTHNMNLIMRAGAPRDIHEVTKRTGLKAATSVASFAMRVLSNNASRMHQELMAIMMISMESSIDTSYKVTLLEMQLEDLASEASEKERDD